MSTFPAPEAMKPAGVPCGGFPSRLPGRGIGNHRRGVVMTRNEILQATHASYSEFLHIWTEHRRDRGMGALVFVSGAASGIEDEVRCEYWTLGDLRHYLRSVEQCDEVFYQWLKNAERAGGCPIVIFSPGTQGDGEQLHYSCVRGSEVS